MHRSLRLLTNTCVREPSQAKALQLLQRKTFSSVHTARSDEVLRLCCNQTQEEINSYIRQRFEYVTITQTVHSSKTTVVVN